MHGIARYMYPHLDVITQNNYTYMIFSASSMTDTISYKLYYAFLPNNYTSGLTGYSDITKLLTNETMFTGYAQITPKGIYDTNNRRILVVWNGKSSNDVDDSTLRGTYYKFINLAPTDTTTGDNLLTGTISTSTTTAVKLTSFVPA